MNKMKRQRFSSEFKAEVAFEATGGVKTLKEIGQEYGVHPVQVGTWKKELLEQAPSLFEMKRGKKPVDSGVDKEKLYPEIVRLKVELEWFKSRVRDYPMAERRAWIDENDTLPITTQCLLAGINRSTYYLKLTSKSPNTEELKLLELIDKEYTLHPSYGSRRITNYLCGLGYRINRKRVQRLMRLTTFTRLTRDIGIT